MSDARPAAVNNGDWFARPRCHRASSYQEQSDEYLYSLKNDVHLWSSVFVDNCCARVNGSCESDPD